MALNKTTFYTSEQSARFRQGDILRDVRIVEWAEVFDDEVVLTDRLLPYCVVLSQDCDLEHDFNNRTDAARLQRDTDKFLQSILLCPAYLAVEVKQGIHLLNSDLKMQKIGSDEWKRVKQNSTYRYHYLPEEQDLQLPELAIDFKHYLTMPRQIAYRGENKTKVIASLDDLFREHLSSRFAHYLSRIGLPELDSA